MPSNRDDYKIIYHAPSIMLWAPKRIVLLSQFKYIMPRHFVGFVDLEKTHLHRLLICLAPSAPHPERRKKKEMLINH